MKQRNVSLLTAAITVAAATCLAYRLLRKRRRGEERLLRQDLAAAHTLSHHFGFDELVWNHISARLDGEKFLITSGSHHFDEVTPDSLVVSSPANANITGDVIHRAIYEARPDVGAIVHHHTTATVAVGLLKGGLQILTQDGAAFHERVAYYEWEGVSTDYDEKQRIAAAFGPSANTLIMRNHGVVTVGKTVAEAWVRHFYLDRCCRAQVAALSAAASGGGADGIVQPDAKTVAGDAENYNSGCFAHGRKEWAALLRLADRLQAAHPAHRRGWFTIS